MLSSNSTGWRVATAAAACALSLLAFCVWPARLKFQFIEYSSS